MKNPRIQKIKNIIFTGLIMILGLILLKYIPMYIWGKNILFDASAHLTITIFIIYVGYLFIEKSKRLKKYYIPLSMSAITIVAIDRIITNNHNYIGLLLGLFISLLAIYLTNHKKLNGEIKF